MIVADVKNTPRTLISGYMVARAVDGELWYYGTYEEKDRADNVAQEIGNGVVLKVMKVKEYADCIDAFKEYALGRKER